MYIDKDARGRYSLQDMDVMEAEALASMIRSAALEERRTFYHVLKQLEKEAGV